MEQNKCKTQNPFQLNLSVSHRNVLSKEEGETVVNFKYLENISLDTSTLTELFTEHLQSTNI